MSVTLNKSLSVKSVLSVVTFRSHTIKYASVEQQKITTDDTDDTDRSIVGRKLTTKIKHEYEKC